MDGNFPRSVTFYGINEKSRELHQRVHVRDVEPSLHEPPQGTVIWHTTSASLAEHQKEAVNEAHVALFAIFWVSQPTKSSSDALLTPRATPPL
jgi:hypothetical protein